MHIKLSELGNDTTQTTCYVFYVLGLGYDFTDFTHALKLEIRLGYIIYMIFYNKLLCI